MPHVDDGTLHALLDGALRAEEPGRADAVEAHLDACADCRARLKHAAALRDQAGDVLGALDAGLAAGGDQAAAVPDFGEVLARAATGAGDRSGTAEAGDARDRRADSDRLRRQLGWTRGLAWAATIAVALGTGYMIRDLAGPTGQVPRASRPLTESEAVPDAVETAAPARDAAPGTTTTPGMIQDAAPRRGAVPAGDVDAEGGGDQAAARQTSQSAPAAAAKTAADAPETPEEAPPQPARADIQTFTVEAAEPISDRAPEGGGVQAARSLQGVAPTGGVRSAERAETAVEGISVPEPTAVSDAAVDVLSGIDAVVGCYRLTVGEWPPELSDRSGYRSPPALFELTDSVGTELRERGRLLLRPRIGDAGPNAQPSAFWLPVAADSIHLVWTDGLIGLRARMAVRGSSALEGRIEAVSDDMSAGPSPGAPAWAVPVDCPGEGGG